MCSNFKLQACKVSMHMQISMQKQPFPVCLCLSMFVSVCDLFINVARTCIHTHTNARNGCTNCMHLCKCTKTYAPFLAHSLLWFRLVSLSSKDTFICPFQIPDPAHSVWICAKHKRMITQISTHASRTCKHLMCDAHAHMHVNPLHCLYVCVPLCLYLSVCCLSN